MSDTELQLKVVEAIQDDVNKGIVRIDTSFMKQLGLSPGSFVTITGERTTVALVDRALPGDIGLNIIRMDGVVRRNAKTSIGSFVTVGAADVVPAEKITISPSREGVSIKANPLFFRQGLLGRAMVNGDLVALGGANRRRVALSGSPLEDVFNELQNGISRFGIGDLKFVVGDIKPKKSAVVVTENTNVQYVDEVSEEQDEETTNIPEVSYEDIGGLDEELHKVREMIEIPMRHPELFEALGIEPPKGVLLHGPPGTGKTLLAKAVAHETNSNFYVINGPEIMSKFYGQSEENLRKIFEEAEANAPSIIFIDEIDAIAPKREESKGEVERRVVAQLLTIMDGLNTRGRVVVMAASNIPNALDPALRRPGRFDREIVIGAPSVEGRLNVLKIHTRNMPLDENIDLNKLALVTHGFVGADLASLAKEAAMIVLRRFLPDLQKLKEGEEVPQSFLSKIRIREEDFHEALRVVRPSAMREVLVETPNVTYEDVGGLDSVKQDLAEAVEWPLKHKEVFTRMGVRPPRGVLLYGPPGTGKTLLAKAVANEAESNFIAVKGPELLSKWVNETPARVKKIFEKARQVSPAIIFIDEIDAVASSRSAQSDDKNSTGMNAVNQLLTEMDGLEELNDVVVIAATNRPDTMDPALLRPGRFDRIILVSVPDVESRQKIFKAHLKNMKLAKNVQISELVQKTEGYVGADIEAVCREAAMFQLRKDFESKEVTMKAFEQALEKVRASASKEIQEAYAELQKKFSSAQGERFKEERPSYYG